MAAAEQLSSPGGVAGELHFDVREDLIQLEALLHVLKLATSPAARDGMAGQHEGLRWRINMAGGPIKIAWVGDGSWQVAKWEWSAGEVPWSFALAAVRSRTPLEVIAGYLEARAARRSFWR